MMSVEVEFPARPEAAPQARRIVTQLSDLTPEVREDAALLVSELVGNALRHGEFRSHDSIQIHADVREEKLHVAVTNPGWADVPHVRNPDLLETGGRGLMMVDMLAADWGVDLLDDERVRVWFELWVDRAVS